MCRAWVASVEAELVRPDDPRGRGAVWPWGIGAVTWRPDDVWEAAMAVESSASPEVRWRLDALLRVSRRWEGP